MTSNSSIVQVKVLKKSQTAIKEIPLPFTSDIELLFVPCSLFSFEAIDFSFGGIDFSLHNYLPSGYALTSEKIIQIPIGYEYLCIDKSGVVMACVFEPINVNGYLFPAPGTKYKILGGLYLKTDIKAINIFKESEATVIKVLSDIMGTN